MLSQLEGSGGYSIGHKLVHYKFDMSNVGLELAHWGPRHHNKVILVQFRPKIMVHSD